MLDLGTLQAQIKLNGADKFKSDLETSGSKADKTGGRIKNGLGRAGKFIGKSFAAAGIAIGTAFGVITKKAVDAYADTEQLRGGVEKLFGKQSAKTIEKNAQAAFATVGISANEYMETVTSFSASLLQSLGGDSEAAANSADMALRDMADNANTFGSDMASIQNAYQGFAKQNYTMLDNLKLGYGGTKTEMERLLADAGKLTGKKYDISNLNDVCEAIHAIQVEQGITGTTAKEASKTISGSINATKAAWTNFLAGLADPKANIGALADNLVSSVTNVIKNIVPVLERVIGSIGKYLPKLLSSLVGLLPGLIKMVLNLIEQVGKAIIQALPELVNVIVKAFPLFIKAMMKLMGMLIDALPSLMDSIIDGIVQIINYIANALPQIIPEIIELVVAIVKALTRNLPKILKALIIAIPPILLALLKGAGTLLLEVGKLLIGWIKKGITKGATAIFNWFKNLPKRIVKAIGSVGKSLVGKGKNLIGGLKNGVTFAWKVVKQFFKNLPRNIVRTIGNVGRTLLTKGRTLINGLRNGVTGAWKVVKTWFSGLGRRAFNAIGSVISAIKSKGSDLISGLKSGVTGAWSGLKDWFTNLPSRIKKAIGSLGSLLSNAGKNLMQGLLNGITAGWKWVKDKVSGMGKWIKDNKGPKAYDLKLLVPNGQWIMSGLNQGLENGKKKLKDTLGGIASSIANTDFNAAANLSYSTSGAGAVNGNSAYNIYIDGARINDDAQIEGKFKELLTLMARRGLM